MNVQEQQYEELAGDPDHLQTMAQRYLTIADAIRNSVTALHGISNDDLNKSEVTDKLKSSASDVADDITKAESRYRITAQALLDYVPSLRTAKSDAHTAVVNIQHFQGEVDTTGTALTKANAALKSATDSDKDDATTTQGTAKTNAADAQSSLDHWQKQWEAAKNTRDTAAETAKNSINDVVQHHNNGLKNPTHHWWSDAWHWVASHAAAVGKWVYDHLDDISSWLGIASLLLGWVPFLGQALLIATLVVGVLKLSKDIAEGKGWKAILGDSVGIALTALAGGAGKYLVKAGRFRAMEGTVGGTSSKAATKFGSDSKAFNSFKSTFGAKPMQFSKTARNLEGGAENVVKPGLKTFLTELKGPFKFQMKNPMTELSNYVKSGGGMNIAKLGKDVSFAQGANVLKQMSTMDKIGLLALDGRKGLTTVQTITNASVNAAHGNFSMNPANNPHQVTLQPEKVLINVLPGGK